MFRRLLHDDDKGVAENLNETVCFNNNKTCEGLTVSSAFLPRIHIFCSDVFLEDMSCINKRMFKRKLQNKIGMIWCIELFGILNQKIVYGRIAYVPLLAKSNK